MRLPRREDRHAVPAFAALLAIAFVALLDLRTAIVMSPLALLAAVMCFGYRPGEKLIERIHENRRKRLSRRPTRAFLPRIESARIAVQIRRLLAIDLAMRPPPSLSTS